MSDNFYHFLKEQIRQDDLPGRSAQLKMVPEPKSKQATKREMEPSASAVPSSVLILLFPGYHGKLKLVLTVRSNDIAHGGQISFPGGRQEEHESTIETALREANEEIGVQPSDVTIAGQLSTLFVNVSNNVVRPIVGFLSDTPAFEPNHDEVQEVFTVLVDDLLSKQNITTQTWQLRPGLNFQVPFWTVHSTPLWGATAMMLSEFLEIYKKFRRMQ